MEEPTKNLILAEMERDLSALYITLRYFHKVGADTTQLSGEIDMLEAKIQKHKPIEKTKNV